MPHGKTKSVRCTGHTRTPQPRSWCNLRCSFNSGFPLEALVVLHAEHETGFKSWKVFFRFWITYRFHIYDPEVVLLSKTYFRINNSF